MIFNLTIAGSCANCGNCRWKYHRHFRICVTCLATVDRRTKAFVTLFAPTIPS